MPTARFRIADAVFWKGVFRGAAAVSAAILAGRVLGLARELALVSKLGISGGTDAAVVALTSTDLLSSVFLAGALSSVLVPEMAHAHEARSRGDGAIATSPTDTQLLWQAVGFSAVASLLVAACAAALAGSLVHLLAPGISGESSREAIHLARISVWSFPALAVTAGMAAFMQHRRWFGLPASVGLITNAVVLLTLVALVEPGSLTALPLAYVAGAALVVAVLGGRIIRREGRPYFGTWVLTSRMLRSYAQALVASSGILLVPFVTRALASHAGPGALAVVNVGGKLIELPNGTVLSALTVVIFPHIAADFAAGNTRLAERHARRGAHLVLVLSVVAAMLLALPADLWAGLLFGGAAATSDVDRISGYTQAASVGLPAQAVTGYLLALFATRRDFLTPTLVVFTVFAGYALASVTFLGSEDRMLTLRWIGVAQALVFWLIGAGLTVTFGLRHQVWLFVVGGMHGREHGRAGPRP